MNKKQLFKFSGLVTSKSRALDWDFVGYFVKQEGKDDILGINRDIVGNNFLKGLFIDNQKLIFVEVAKEMRIVRDGSYHQKGGYAFKDINKIGKYSKDDMEGIFAWTDGYVVIQLSEVDDHTPIQIIERQYEQFYEILDDYERFYFDDSKMLRKFL